MALAALKLGKRTPQQTIHDPGLLPDSGQAHRSATTSRAATASVDMYKSIVVSCDTYYYMLANDTRHRRHRATSCGQLGFGQQTGIDIEGELTRRAAVARMEAAALRRQELREEHEVVRSAIRSRLGIGQGYNAFTPLQLAHAIATIAADGVMLHAAPGQVRSRTCETGEARD